jgi:uncharacterized protein
MNHLVDALPLLIACTLAFVAGGIVKGTISIGLPVVGLPLLTLVIDVRTAIGLLLVPILVSNVVQVFEGKGTWPLLRRFWRLTAALAVGLLVGTALLARMDPKQLLLVVGSFALAASLVMIAKPNLAIPPRAEPWLSIPIGLAAGVMGGISSMFGPLLTIYMLGLKLDRDDFVTAVSLVFTIAAVFLLAGAASNGAAGPAVLAVSTLCMVPVYAGMLIGRKIRDRLHPALFYRIVLAAVFLGGANMVRQGLGF